MTTLLAAVALGAVGIVAGIALLWVFKGQKRWFAILPFGFGLACLTVVGILLLSLQHFGMAPRDGNQTVEVIEHYPGSYR